MAVNRCDLAPVFTRDEITAMHAAFERVCAQMQLKGTKAAPAIELVAIRIVELARAGEFDPEKLTSAVLAEFGGRANGTQQTAR